MLVGGIVGAIAFVVAGVRDISEDRQVVPVPGTGEVHFPAAGTMLVSFEETGSAPARVPAGLEIRIYSPVSSEPLPLSALRATYTYHYAGVAGRGVGEVEIQQPGTYRVETTLPDAAVAPPGAGVAIGSNPVGSIFKMVFGAFAVAGGGALLALVVVLVVALRRSSFRKAQSGRQMPPYPTEPRSY